MQCRFASGFPESSAPAFRQRNRPTVARICPPISRLVGTHGQRAHDDSAFDRPGRSLFVRRRGLFRRVGIGGPVWLSERSSIDVDILDERGRLMMRVGQYRTEPLPFVGNATAPPPAQAAAEFRVAEKQRSQFLDRITTLLHGLDCASNSRQKTTTVWMALAVSARIWSRRPSRVHQRTRSIRQPT